MVALLSQVITGLAVGAAYSLIAVAVVLIYSGTKTLSIAMGEIGAFGLFVGLHWRANAVPGTDYHPSALMAGVIAVVLGALLGLVVERVVMRPLVRRPPLDGLIATLGVALLLALLELKMFGADPVPAPSPVGKGVVEVLDAPLPATRVAAFVLAVIVAIALFLFLTRTKFGLATRAATSDPTVARLLGVKVNSVYMFAWGVGGALSGLAAAVLAPAFGNLTPFAQTQFSLRALAGAVIGGLDSVWGAIVGSLLVGIVETVVQSNVDSSQNGYASMAVLVLVLGTLLVRPRGILGTTGVA
ncbi:MAG TPA: branched-chain amino acid ABC transporter permease [Mycobacteriales bacterium]|nr:branched-chain amino acid ABC transporter permease [Mycobacteriales bacterium]